MHFSAISGFFIHMYQPCPASLSHHLSIITVLTILSVSLTEDSLVFMCVMFRGDMLIITCILTNLFLFLHHTSGR